MGADELGVAGPDAHAELDLRVVVLVLRFGVVDQDADQILLRNGPAVFR